MIPMQEHLPRSNDVRTSSKCPQKYQNVTLIEEAKRKKSHSFHLTDQSIIGRKQRGPVFAIFQMFLVEENINSSKLKESGQFCSIPWIATYPSLQIGSNIRYSVAWMPRLPSPGSTQRKPGIHRDVEVTSHPRTL